MTSDVKRLGASELKRQLHEAARSRCSMRARKGFSSASSADGVVRAAEPARIAGRRSGAAARHARVVWCDDGEGLALRAARRMSGLGYQDVAVFDGGIAAWEAAGYRIYSGVHVPSKAFAEVVEHEAGTPWISAPELQGADRRRRRHRDFRQPLLRGIPQQQHPDRDQRAGGRAGLPLRRSWCRRPTRRSSSIAAAAPAASSARSR